MTKQKYLFRETHYASFSWNNCKRFLCLLFCFVWHLSFCQEASFTQFYVNPSLLNPSFTGSEGQSAMFISYRKQWVGLEGSPTVMNFNIQTSLPNRLNLGLNISNQKAGLVSSSGLLIAGGYTLPVGNNKFVRFGMSAGGTSNTIDINALNFGNTAISDPLLANISANSLQLSGNLGITYHTKSFHFGVALPSLFHPVYLSPSSFNVDIKPTDNVIVHASNRFYLQKGKNVFEPYVVYRLYKGLPGQIEVAALFHYQHLGWIGASYKQDYGVSGLIGLKINKLMALGYSYGVPSNGANEIGLASHEIHVAYLFGQHKKKIAHLYSFVNTELEPEKKKAAPVVAAKKPLPPKVEPKKEPAPAPVAKVEPAPVPPKPTEVVHPPESVEKIARLEVHAENPKEEHNSDIEHPNATRHDRARQGEHHAEMDLGHYVIAGSFSSEEHAKQYSDGLVKMGFSETDYGYVSEKGHWYVHIDGSDDINEARKIRDVYRRLAVFRDAWLLTIHKE